MEIIAIYLLAAVVLVMIGTDIFFAMQLWLSRIRIGKIRQGDAYMAHITALSQQWIRQTPTVRLTDNTRLIILDILKGNFRNDTIQFWQKAGLLIGLAELGQAGAYDTLLKEEAGKETPPEADYVIYSYALLKLAVLLHKEQEYAAYFHRVYQMILELKGSDTSVRYKTYTEHYRFVDTLGFICPYLVLYGQVFKNDAAVDLAIGQLEEFDAHGLYPGSSLPVHAYHYHTRMPLGLYGWARGMGWYAIALADVRELMDPAHPYYQAITERVARYAKLIMDCQRPDGSWGWQVLVREMPADSSATVMLSWLLVNASDIPEISADCRQVVHKSVTYLMSVTRRNGAIDFCQGDTKSIGVYSRIFDVLPFAQGYALRLLSRVQKSKHEYGFEG